LSSSELQKLIEYDDWSKEDTRKLIELKRKKLEEEQLKIIKPKKNMSEKLQPTKDLKTDDTLRNIIDELSSHTSDHNVLKDLDGGIIKASDHMPTLKDKALDSLSKLMYKISSGEYDKTFLRSRDKVNEITKLIEDAKREFNISGNDILNRQKQISGKRAQGGLIGAMKSYIVGEKGPEVITSLNDGLIIPKNIFDAMNEIRGFRSRIAETANEISRSSREKLNNSLSNLRYFNDPESVSIRKHINDSFDANLKQIISEKDKLLTEKLEKLMAHSLPESPDTKSNKMLPPIIINNNKRNTVVPQSSTQSDTNEFGRHPSREETEGRQTPIDKNLDEIVDQIFKNTCYSLETHLRSQVFDTSIVHRFY
jgi:hypothetical protein